MDKFVFVLLIIGIVTCGRVAQTYLKRTKKQPESSDDAEEMLLTIERLEDRIKVLERIITEKHIDLRQEIDKL